MRKGQEQEQNYQEYKRLGQRLGIPVIEAWLELEVTDKNGKVVHRHRQRSHSWTRNLYNVLFCQTAQGSSGTLYEAGSTACKETGTALKTGIIVGKIPQAAFYGYYANVGVATIGIVVGSGVAAESFEDYALQTPITHGTGSGQLTFVASEPQSISYASLTLTNTLVRYMNNNSGASIDVNEVALYSYSGYFTSAGGQIGYFLCMARDKLASTVAVPDTGQLKVTYTISLVYPG